MDPMERKSFGSANGAPDGNGNGGGMSGPGGLPKLKEIMRRQRPDSDDEEAPDVEFDYGDSDTLAGEMAEFYSYTENPEFPGVHKAFEESMERFGLPARWKPMDAAQRTTCVQLLLNQTEVTDRDTRLAAARALLYVAQGCWLENQNDADCLKTSKENVMLLHRNGVFGSFVELLNLEMENASAASNAVKKLAVSLADSTELRVILGVLYIMTEVLRNHEDQQVRENFAAELSKLVKRVFKK